MRKAENFRGGHVLACVPHRGRRCNRDEVEDENRECRDCGCLVRRLVTRAAVYDVSGGSSGRRCFCFCCAHFRFVEVGAGASATRFICGCSSDWPPTSTFIMSTSPYGSS